MREGARRKPLNSAQCRRPHADEGCTLAATGRHSARCTGHNCHSKQRTWVAGIVLARHSYEVSRKGGEGR